MSLGANERSGAPRRRQLRPTGKLLAEDARRHHRALMLQRLFSEGPVSRADLARATGLTRVTVSDLVGGLIDDGLIVELGSPAATRVGKPPTLVGIAADARHIVALDLSPDDRMIGTVQDLLGVVKARVELPREGRSGAQAVRLAVRLAAELLRATDRTVLGIGVGSPGIVDARGVVLDAPNLSWRDVDLAGMLHREFGVPVHVANDANTAVLGEHTFGEAGDGDFLLLRIATGVGAGLVVGGVLVQGHGSAAGEIGHVIVDPGGKPCACGRVGCLETVLAVPRLRERDPAALAQVGEVLGEVLAPVVGLLNLHQLVLAGPRDLLDGALRDAVDRTVRERTMAVTTADFVVRTSPLGDDVVLAGAAVLVLSGELGVS
ncbi:MULTISPECIES: ROK family transcriptional regulator [unclassified Pseudofrankia]|uniref:ROK family transcriptional regulator n=1 Tax=unclassified Pseudofrankia TaxID=2994372 RepID=UPI0009F41E92|nr:MULTISPECIES: ROK family transcriptional regulator [unclassified Pseudofrankia]MDT3438197.1 ROK family transcriptional regulator [Pseudofrankia sp. BMG5.37]